MEAMARVGTFFSGHPLRIAAAAVVLALGAAIGWYLGSPLFVRTYADEALPSAAPAASTSSPLSGTVGATPTPAGPVVIAMGELGYVDAIHNGNGPVRIVQTGGQRFVRFEDVMITNAPDIHVYLSRDIGGRWAEASSLYLGALKATNGSFNYELPASADVGSYRSVVVWCRAFSVLITWADLK